MYVDGAAGNRPSRPQRLRRISRTPQPSLLLCASRFSPKLGVNHVHTTKERCHSPHDHHGWRDGSRRDEAGCKGHCHCPWRAGGGPGWRAVYELLTNDGFHVAIVPEPPTSLPEGGERPKRLIDQATGPVG